MFSYWQQDVFLAPVDVLIIGAGFAGLWCAYEMKTRQPSLSITVLEKEAFPGGASVRNAGFACFGSPGEMLADAALMGEDAVWQTVAMRYKGIQKIRKLLGDANIDYDPCGGYECFTDATAFQPVSDSLPWLNEGMKKATGIENAFAIADEKLPGSGLQNFRHLIANQHEGGLHSGKALKRLLQKVTGSGINVLFCCEVNIWEPSENGVIVAVKSAKPFSLKTNRLLLATNAFTSTLTPAATVQPARGQILMTEPIKGLQLRGTFHFDEGFYYWRNVGSRVLLGGARNTSFTTENTFDAEPSDTIQQALEAFLYRHISLQQPFKIEHRWAGIMGFTETKKPMIQQVETNVWAVVACNGMGVALTPMMAEETAAQLLA